MMVPEGNASDPQPLLDLRAFFRQISTTLATFFSRARKLVRLGSGFELELAEEPHAATSLSSKRH